MGLTAEILKFYIQAEEDRVAQSLSDLHLSEITAREGLSNESIRLVIAVKEVVQSALNEEAEIRMAASVDAARQRYVHVMQPFIRDLARQMGEASLVGVGMGKEQEAKYRLVKQDLKRQIEAMDDQVQNLREVYAHHKVRLLTTFDTGGNDSNYYMRLGSFKAIQEVTTMIAGFLTNNVQLRIRYQLAPDGLSELRAVRDEVKSKQEEIDGLWQSYRKFRLSKITYNK